MTNLLQYDTNIYRVGELNLPKRMENILRMSPAPDYVEIQTWVSNDWRVGEVWANIRRRMMARKATTLELCGPSQTRTRSREYMLLNSTPHM